jgi:hypothetical protein
MSSPIDPANTSTSTTAAATSADGQTKQRAVGATIDGDEPRVAAGADLADVDVTTADNGSSSGGSGGKRKRAAGMIFGACFLLRIKKKKKKKIFFSQFFLFFPFFFVSTASTSALPTIDSLIAEKHSLVAEKNSLVAEKNSLVGEKQELQDRVRAGVSEAVWLAISAEITGLNTRITGIDARIAGLDTLIAGLNTLIAGLDARIRDRAVPLAMSDVNAWLDSNPLGVDEPATPTSALWWQLGEKSFNAKAAEWADHAGLNVLVGVSGAGKTRTMYELLTHRFGFYWTCSRLGNGGSTHLKSKIGDMPERLTEANKHLVDSLVREHMIAYSILLLQWRRRFPNGSPLQWHVFQTNAAVVDSALDAIFAFLKTCTTARESMSAALNAATAAVGGAGLLLVVDEAQELTLRGEFASRVMHGEKRTLLSLFAGACYEVTALYNVWFTGTSFSLRSAVHLAGSAGGKDTPGLIAYCDLAFGEVSRFREYLCDVVGASISDALADELFTRFRGRARPVAVLAEYLVKSKVREIKDDDTFRERVLDVATVCERDLLARPMGDAPKVSLVQAFMQHVDRTQSGDYLHRFVEIAKAAFAERVVVVTADAEVMSEHGVGQVTEGDVVKSADGAITVQSLTVSEPLVPKMLIAVALALDPTGSKGLHPVVSVLHDMTASLQPSVCGFLLEVLVVPIIHKFFVARLGAGSAAPPGVLVRAQLLQGLARQLPAFGPEHVAGPDAVHTFGEHGALGQVKFRASMSDAQWTDALRTVDLAQLYSEKVSDKELSVRQQQQRATRLKNKAELRRQAVEILKLRWASGYCSYIFTVCEPPAGVEHVNVVDGRERFVFSPRLSPLLFDGVARGVNLWEILARIKEQQ